MSQHYNDGRWHDGNQYPPRQSYTAEGDSRGRQRGGQASDRPYQSHDGTSDGAARPFVPRASTDLAVVPRHTNAQPDIKHDNRPQIYQSDSPDGYYGFSNPNETSAYRDYGRAASQPQPMPVASASTAPFVQVHRSEGDRQRGSQGTLSEAGGQYHDPRHGYYPSCNLKVAQPLSPYDRDAGRPPLDEAHISPQYMRAASYPQSSLQQTEEAPYQGSLLSLPANDDLDAQRPLQPHRPSQPPPYPGAPRSRSSLSPHRPPDEGQYSPPQTRLPRYPQSPPPRHPHEYSHPQSSPGQNTSRYRPRQQAPPSEDDALQVLIQDALEWYAPVDCKIDTGNETGCHLISKQMTLDLGFTRTAYGPSRVGSIDTLGGTAQTVGSILLRWRVEMDGQIYPHEDWFEIFDHANFPYDVIFTTDDLASAPPGAAAAPSQKALMMIVMGKKKRTEGAFEIKVLRTPVLPISSHH